MKAIICEMCGSRDIIKQEGMYICQSCGTKYTVEEAKKLLVDGTVRIDNTDKISNLFKAARQARDNDDSENAAKYYDLIIQEDPTSWEAFFYNVYYRANQTRIINIASAAYSIRNCLGSTFSLIKNHVEDLTDQKSAVIEISARVSLICMLFEVTARNHFRESWDHVWAKYEDSHVECLRYGQEYHKRSEAVYETLFTLGDLIEENYGNDTDMCSIAVTTWKSAIQYCANDYEVFDDWVQNKKHIDDTYGEKVRKYEQNYAIPSPNYEGFPTAFVTLICKDRSNQSYPKTDAFSTDRLTNMNQPYKSDEGNLKTGGCYVATAVYGSYDCPQVWTLRRYRDDTLAATWYGRAFIHTYYAISPTLVKWFGETEWFRKLWKPRLDRMVAHLHAEGVADTPYQDRNW